MMMISCAAMIIEMRTLYLKRLPKVLHQNENCQYCLVRPQCKKKKKNPEGNESADKDDDEAVEINKKTIKKIKKNKTNKQKTLKKFNKNGHIAVTTVVAIFKRAVVVMMAMYLKTLTVLDMARQHFIRYTKDQQGIFQKTTKCQSDCFNF